MAQPVQYQAYIKHVNSKFIQEDMLRVQELFLVQKDGEALSNLCIMPQAQTTACKLWRNINESLYNSCIVFTPRSR